MGDKANEASRVHVSLSLSFSHARDSLLREAKRVKGEGGRGREGEDEEGKVLGRVRLLALARRDEGETRIDRYPAGVLRANRYPGASIRPYFVAVGPRAAFSSARSGASGVSERNRGRGKHHERRGEDGRESPHRRGVQATGVVEPASHLLSQSRGD